MNPEKKGAGRTGKIIAFTDTELTVDSLKPVEKVDVFEGVSVSFLGKSGLGEAQVDTSGSEYSEV